MKLLPIINLGNLINDNMSEEQNINYHLIGSTGFEKGKPYNYHKIEENTFLKFDNNGN